MPAMSKYVVSQSTRGKIESMVLELDNLRLDEAEAYRIWPQVVSSLPSDYVEAILRFRDSQVDDLLWIRNLPVGAMSTMPTPLDAIGAARLVYGYAMVSLASLGLLGMQFAYSSQQGGRLINNIAPMPDSSETPNLGVGSGRPFDLHSEDAFMTDPPRYIQLACVRNTTDTPLTVAGFSGLLTDESALRRLRQPIYLVHTNAAQRGWGESRLRTGPVVWGGVERPFMRFNSINTSVEVDEPGGAAALELLHNTLKADVMHVYLRPGDLVVLDNHRLCHARRAFKAKFDGTDRWLLRIVAYREPGLVSGLTRFAPYPILSPE